MKKAQIPDVRAYKKCLYVLQPTLIILSGNVFTAWLYLKYSGEHWGWPILVFTRELARVCWAVRNVRRPPCASCGTRWLTGFCRQSLFLCRQIPSDSGPKGWSGVGESGCPSRRFWTRGHNTVMGLSYEARNAPFSVVSWLKSAIYCSMSYMNLQIV